MVLERITPIGKPLSENKVKDAWNKINVFLFLVKPDPSGGYSVICINSTSLPEEINITNLVSNKLSKPKKLTCEPKTITKIKINNCEKIFLSSDVKSINDAAQEWISGKDLIKSKSSPVIAYFSGAKKPKKKLEITNSRLINLVFVPPKVDPKKQDGFITKLLGLFSRPKAKPKQPRKGLQAIKPSVKPTANPRRTKLEQQSVQPSANPAKKSKPARPGSIQSQVGDDNKSGKRKSKSPKRGTLQAQGQQDSKSRKRKSKSEKPSDIRQQANEHRSTEQRTESRSELREQGSKGRGGI